MPRRLRPQFLHPPLPIADYERLLEDGIRQCQAAERRVVLLGPGGFNEDTKTDHKLQSPELWRSVNEMVLGLGQRLGVPVVNVREALREKSGDVYMAGDHRFSVYGQAVVAREVGQALANEILALQQPQESIPAGR